MLGDFVILRSDGRPTYNFAVVVDDALMEITHVIRAEEHLPNTMRQVLLYGAMGFVPPKFAHVSLIVDKDRSKLSKRRGATSVAEFRERGYLPGALVNYLALLGWSPPDERELLSASELVASFDIAKVSAAPAAFDQDKLDWVNGHHLREEPLDRVAALARPFAEAAGLVERDETRFRQMIDLVRPRLSTLSDVPGEIGIFFEGAWQRDEEAARALATPTAAGVVRGVRDALTSNDSAVTVEAFKGILSSVGKEMGVKGKDLYIPVRAAMTGATHGPGLGEIASILGRARILRRLEDALGSQSGGAVS